MLPNDPCMAVLLFWIAPFATGLAGFIAAAVAALLGRTLRAESLKAPIYRPHTPCTAHAVHLPSVHR